MKKIKSMAAMILFGFAAVCSGDLITQDAIGASIRSMSVEIGEGCCGNSFSSASERKSRSGNILYEKDIVEIKGKNVSKSYKVKNFDKILSNNMVDIEYVQGPLGVKVTAPSGLFDYLYVIVKGGELRIDIDSKKGLKLQNNQKVKAYVSSPSLKRVKCNGSADFDITSLNADKLELAFNGSGDFEWKKGSVERIEATANGSGDMEFENLSVRKGVFTSNGSGDISLKRVKGESVVLRSNGSGDIEAENVDFIDVTADSAGSGDIDVSGCCKFRNISSRASGKIDDRKLKRC